MSDIRRDGQCRPGSVSSSINISELQFEIIQGVRLTFSSVDNFDFSLKNVK